MTTSNFGPGSVFLLRVASLHWRSAIRLSSFGAFAGKVQFELFGSSMSLERSERLAANWTISYYFTSLIQLTFTLSPLHDAQVAKIMLTLQSGNLCFRIACGHGTDLLLFTRHISRQIELNY